MKAKVACAWVKFSRVGGERSCCGRPSIYHFIKYDPAPGRFSGLSVSLSVSWELCRGPDDDGEDGGVVWVVLEDAFHSYPVKNSHLRTRPTTRWSRSGVSGFQGLRLEQGTALSFSPSLPYSLCCWWRIKFQELVMEKGRRPGRGVSKCQKSCRFVA